MEFAHTPLRRAVLCAVALSSSVACESEPPEPTSTAPPTLRRLAAPALDSIGPERLFAAMAVSPRGLIAFTTGFDTGSRIVTVIDTLGAVVSRFATRGSGPGELIPGIGLTMNFVDSLLVVFTIGKVTIYTASGQLIASHASTNRGAPTILGRDSLDALIFVGGMSGAPRHVALRREAYASGKGPGVAVGGTLLAVLCIVPAAVSDREVQLRLYRVEENVATPP